MVNKEDYTYFVCIVAGDKPERLMAKYDKNIKVPQYVLYKFADAEKIRQQHILLYKEMLFNDDLSEIEREWIKEDLADIEGESAEDFFLDLTDECDHDEETGDAVSCQNPQGKWSHFNLGQMHSVPFVTFDGREIFQSRKKDIDWSKVHLSGQDIYKRAWEMVMEGSKPKNDYEKNIYENMKEMKNYFRKFVDKETYVISSTSFWGYAFLSERKGWMELEDDMNQFAWMSNFYDMFIKNLPDDTLLTIYECRK